MYIPLRLGLRIQDMFILLALGAIFVGLAYLADVIKATVKGASYERTNFAPWSTPQFYLLTAAAGVALAALNSPLGATLDVQLHDTYLVLATATAGLAVAAYFVLIAFVYFLLRELDLSPWITTLHLVLTLGSCLATYYLLSEPVTEVGFSELEEVLAKQRNTVVAVVTLLGAQFLLPLNIVIGLWRRWRS